MEFIDQLNALSARALKQRDIIKTEEATKNALVMPFIQTLGYDIFDPTEVIPEFTADVGKKKGEKVDYAIVADGQLSMLFECKCCGSNLNDCHASQLRRYFHVTTARIAVLTNGLVYRFFSDLEEPNKMDEKPFMEVNLVDIDPQILPELKKLTKNSFELEKMLSTANDLKYTREIKNLLESEFAAPSQEFVKLILSNVYSGLKTQQVIEQFTPIVKQAINLWLLVVLCGFDFSRDQTHTKRQKDRKTTCCFMGYPQSGYKGISNNGCHLSVRRAGLLKAIRGFLLWAASLSRPMPNPLS
ncbi:type I restriction endonuclease [Desulfofustis limnaeus]|uniref:Type I restriction enzyme R protein N-terminal domain-containing protein n=1 Tax=Desulfofustis limnaeus TaxID=2740163 RepID=A0ABM7W4U5_9BACT|nr:type I restriction enzyme HsdR N-terminal domain-containing protein [Desulfofustis limnaeus]BDD85941.1 hypothetical protein DPPLL_03060 [Desulfofustis limnaeus]